MNRRTLWGSLAGCAWLFGCPAPAANNDVPTTTDATTAVDTPTATDVSALDRADVALDTLMVAYGLCGHATYNCLCACGPDAGNGPDAGACFEACLTSSACQACIRTALTDCCPNEIMDYQTCAGNAQSPSDDGGAAACAQGDLTCINMVCATQYAAANTCGATQACTIQLRTCTGSWPDTCSM